MLHTLRGVLGDSLFFRCLNAYRQRFEGKSAVTTELEAIVDSVSGADMNWFFDQWIFGPGWPEYAKRYSWATRGFHGAVPEVRALLPAPYRA